MRSHVAAGNTKPGGSIAQVDVSRRGRQSRRAAIGGGMPLDSVPLDLGSLPGIVCGPVLRRLTRTSVSVWVACVAPDPITLTVRRRGAGSPPAASVTTTPTRVGANLWMTVLTAGAPGGTFEAGRIYEYELTAAWEATRGAIPWDDLSLRGSDAADVPRSAGERGRARRLPHVVPEAARRRARRVVARAGGHGDALRRPRRRRSRICWSCRATRSTPTRSAIR